MGTIILFIYAFIAGACFASAMASKPDDYGSFKAIRGLALSCIFWPVLMPIVVWRRIAAKKA